MKQIKSFFKGVDETLKSKFKHAQCLITISVGQETQEGERFAATVDLINASFGSCIMLIDDSLQRHTMALNRKEDASFFYETSMKEGDLWLERNEKYYSQLTILKKIIRWDVWLNHPDYFAKQNALRALVNQDPTYKMALDNTIDKFLKKYCERLDEPKNFNKVRARQLCFDYVLEECTAMCLWPEMECHFEVYPNSYNNAMKETHRCIIRPYHPDLLRPVTIRFRNARQSKPQNFVSLHSMM